MGVTHETEEVEKGPAVTPVDDDAWAEIWNKRNLEQWLEQGLSRKDIVVKVAELSGRPEMSVAAVSMAMARWGIPTRRARYEKTLPWRILGDHGIAKETALLRALGRLAAGGKLSDKEALWLAGWIDRLREAGSPVITYIPDSPDGFYPIRRDRAESLETTYVDPVTLYDSLQ